MQNISQQENKDETSKSILDMLKVSLSHTILAGVHGRQP